MNRRDRLHGALRAWADELDALVPARWRARKLPRRAVVLLAQDGHFEAVRIGARRPVPLGVVDLDRPGVGEALRAERLPIVLRLPQDRVLQTDDLLPAAAEADLGPIVLNRLDALSPWPPGGCRFDQEIVARDPVEGLTVRVTMAPRRVVDDLVARLAERDIAVAHVDVADGDRWAPPRIDLLRSGELRAGGVRWGRLAAGVAALATVAGVAFVGLGWTERAGTSTARTEVATLEREAAALAPLRERAAALRAQAEALAARGAAVPSALAVLDDLSRLLPDDAWLEELRLAGDRVEIGGYAADAAPLLRLLEDDPTLGRAEFRSASTRTTVTLPDGGSREVDRFAIALVAEQARRTP